jgi:hypothetical protein
VRQQCRKSVLNPTEIGNILVQVVENNGQGTVLAMSSTERRALGADLVTNCSCSLCADCSVFLCVLSGCWAASTSALGFLAHPLGAGETSGGAAKVRSEVDIAIRALAHCLAGRRSHRAAKIR